MSGSTEFAWSTEGVARDEQFAYWREVVWQAFLPLAPERSGKGGFSGAVSGRGLGPLTVSRVGAQAQRVRRSQELIDRVAGDTIHLNLQVRGDGESSQDGRNARQRPGDMSIVDCTRPFELRFGGDFQQISVGFPLDLLGPRLALPQAATAVRVSGAFGLGAVIAAQLRTLARPAAALDREAGALLADQLTELLALSLGRARSLPSSANRALLLQAAIDRVERELGDPGLSVAAVAHHVNVSTRHLQSLFAEQGTSFGRWVLARRLERCHRDLTEPALSHLTIGQISERWGFADRSHFARAFRARYEVSPRQHRRA